MRAAPWIVIVIVIVIVIAIASAGCLRSTEFKCTDNAQCSTSGSATGAVCESDGYCSFTDTGCPSSRRYGDFAGSLSKQCVGGDGGVDTPAGCPATYMTVGAGTHRYMKIGNANGWSTQRDRCAADGANVYLAIPDDMAELDAIRMLAGARSWIGLNDMMTEGTYMTVRGMPASYVPWDTGSGEPNDGGIPQDCVTALSASPLIATDRCGDPFVAVCECEP